MLYHIILCSVSVRAIVTTEKMPPHDDTQRARSVHILSLTIFCWSFSGEMRNQFHTMGPASFQQWHPLSRRPSGFQAVVCDSQARLSQIVNLLHRSLLDSNQHSNTRGGVRVENICKPGSDALNRALDLGLCENRLVHLRHFKVSLIWAASSSKQPASRT